MFHRISACGVALFALLLTSSSVAAALDTKVEVWHPMSRALSLCAEKALEETPGAKAEDMYWSSVTEDMKVLQSPFMNDVVFKAWGDPVVEGLPAIAGETAEVNQFLREQGFTIQLSPAPLGMRQIAAAAVLKIYPRWKEPGKETEIEYQGKKYPAVHLKGGVEVFTWDWDEKVSVARVATDGPEVFYLLKASDVGSVINIEDLVSSSPFSLTMWAKGMPTTTGMNPSELRGIVFPKVKLDCEEQLNWLVGLTVEFEGAGEEPWRISEALVQNRLTLDEKGASIESAAAVSMSKGMTMPLVIDEPFLLVVFREDEEGRREGSGIPLLTAYVDFSQE